MTLLEVLDYMAKYREDAEESGVLLELLAPIILSRPYLLERAIAEAWPFFEQTIVKTCVDHATEVANIDQYWSEIDSSKMTPGEIDFSKPVVQAALLPHDYQPCIELCIVCGRLASDACHDK